MEVKGVSVIVVCFNEEKKISACIDSILKQDYPSYELIVVDGESQDNTRQIVQEYQKKSGIIKLLVNEKRTISSNRNIGIKAAGYSHIAFTDADCRVPENWLSTLINGYKDYPAEDKIIAGIGGNNIVVSEGNGNFNYAVGAIFNTFLGSLGSIQGKRYTEPRFVDSLACLNVLYDKSRLMEAGGFDEQLGNICEDADINMRLRKKGYYLLYTPKSFVWHNLNLSPHSFIKMMFSYGRGRGMMITKHKLANNPAYILPVLFLLAMLCVPLSFLNKLLLLPLVYFPVILLFSLSLASKSKRPAIFPDVILAYILGHFAYACGEFIGLSVRKYGTRK